MTSTFLLTSSQILVNCLDLLKQHNNRKHPKSSKLSLLTFLGCFGLCMISVGLKQICCFILYVSRSLFMFLLLQYAGHQRNLKQVFFFTWQGQTFFYCISQIITLYWTIIWYGLYINSRNSQCIIFSLLISLTFGVYFNIFNRQWFQPKIAV